MYYMLVLALAVCAHAAVPDYLGAYSNFKVSSDALLTHLNFEPTTTKEEANYMALKGAVTLLAKAVNYDLDYDLVYDFVTDLAVGLGTKYPDVVRDDALKTYQRSKESTEILTSLVLSKCFGGLLLQGDAKCNEELDVLVKKDKWLPLQAQLLLALGDLGSLYLDDAKALQEAALNDNVKIYLQQNKEQLKPLVLKAAKLYKLFTFVL